MSDAAQAPAPPRDPNDDFREKRFSDGTVVYWYSPTGQFSLERDILHPRIDGLEAAHRAARKAKGWPEVEPAAPPAPPEPNPEPADQAPGADD